MLLVNSNAIQNTLNEFLQSPEYVNINAAVEAGETKHQSRIDAMNKWYRRQKKKNGRENITREDVLEKYRMLAAGGLKQAFDLKTGYERQEPRPLPVGIIFQVFLIYDTCHYYASDTFFKMYKCESGIPTAG